MQRIYTERAHLMCPNMCFGIAIAVNRPYDEAAIRDAVKRLAAAHPFMNALLGYAEAENAYYYRVTDRPQVELRLKGGRHDAPESALAAPGIMKEYHQLTGRDWDLFEEGMLKISVWQAGTMTQFLLVFHHLLADGRGALGNYSTAFSVEVKKREVAERETSRTQMSDQNALEVRSLFSLARTVHDRVAVTMARPEDLYLILQCYAELDPGLLDAAFISCKGGFPSKAGKFIGSLFFGFKAGNGYSITNLGAIESESIADAYFIPPASPAICKTQGILTVNSVMTVCTSER